MSTSASVAPNRRARRDLLLVAVLCIAPVLASYLLFYVWRPEGTKNYGELLPPAPVPELASAPESRSPAVAPLAGKWVLLMVDGGKCEASCRQKLWQIRQLRLTQGKDMDRIVRVWVTDDDAAPAADVLADYRGTIRLTPREVPSLAKLPAPASARDHLYLIDPLGNLMMRFPKDPDLNRVKKDLIHLLKVSQVG